jgi:hypothetical protein
MSDITLDVYLNGKKIGFAKSQSWYNSGRMFFVDERTDDKLCKGYFPEDIENCGGFGKVGFKVRAEPKRKPLADGTLPLTESELDSIAKILDIHKIYGVRLIFEKLEYKDYEGCCPEIVNIKAIAYLLERFDLTGI